jgi:WD40 repeat protein
MVLGTIQCLEWSPEDPNVIAAGLATGKVALIHFDIEQQQQQQQQMTGRRTKIFVPKHQRACNAIAWNPVQKHLLAAGLDKVRSDYSCLIWDIVQPGLSLISHSLSFSFSFSLSLALSRSLSLSFAQQATYSLKSFTLKYMIIIDLFRALIE